MNDEGETSFASSVMTEDSDAVAELTAQLQELQNTRNEERFLLVVIIITMADAFIFSVVENWAGAIVIGIIQIFGVAVVARKWQIEEVPQMLSKFLDRTAERVRPPAANTPPNGD